MGGERRMDKLSSCWFSTDYLSRHNMPIQSIQSPPFLSPSVAPSSGAMSMMAVGLCYSASSEPRWPAHPPSTSFFSKYGNCQPENRLLTVQFVPFLITALTQACSSPFHVHRHCATSYIFQWHHQSLRTCTPTNGLFFCI